MNDHAFFNNNYSVAYAEQRMIGKEWNNIVWDKNHLQIGHHRLYFPTSGEATLHLYDKTIKLLPGNIYFIPAFSIVQSEIEGEMNKYYVHFLASSQIFGLYRFLSDKYSAPADEATEYLFRQVVDNYTSDSEQAHLRVQGAMSLLLAPFFADADMHHRNIVRFEKILAHIDENYKRDIPLSELAEMMNVNTTYFSNLFKQVFHISPKQYILNKRLTESQQLLLESEMTVKEIAYAVGFENESYFSEFFSAKVGIPATDFRRRNIPKKRKSIL